MKTSNKNTNEYFNLKRQCNALNRGSAKKASIHKEKLISFIKLTATPKTVVHSNKASIPLKNRSTTKDKCINGELNIILEKVNDANKSPLNNTNKHAVNSNANNKKLNHVIKEYKHKLHMLNSFKSLNHTAKGTNMAFIGNNNNTTAHFKRGNCTPIKHNDKQPPNEVLSHKTSNNKSYKHLNKIKHSSNTNNKSCLISKPSFLELFPKQTHIKTPNRKQKCVRSLLNITNAITSNLYIQHKVNVVHQQHNSLLLNTTSSNTTTHNNSLDIKHKKCHNHNEHQHPISVKLKSSSKYYTPYSHPSQTTENDNACLNTTDENILIHPPKLINYTKQIYSNNYISNLFLSLFNSHKICSSLLAYLASDDLTSLSLINRKLHSVSKPQIRAMILNSILHQRHSAIHSKLWQHLLSKTSIPSSSSPEKEYVINSVKQSPYYNEIVTDIQRMRGVSSANSSKLTHILNTYSNYNANIGYAQGMNHIAHKLLLKYDNDEIAAFHALDSMITLLSFDSVIGVKHKLNWHLSIVDTLISEYVPAFHRHLALNELTHDMFTVSWLITLFSKAIDRDEELHLLWEVVMVFKWEFVYLFMVNVVMFVHKAVCDWDTFEFALHVKDVLRGAAFRREFPGMIRRAVEMMGSMKWGKIKLKLNLI